MSDRPHLVFVPGLLCDAALWAHQIGHMEDIADCHVGDTRSDDTIAGMAHTILQGAPQRFALAGLSMGGYVAFEIMRQAPERVARLALLDTAATPDTEERRQRRLDLIKLAEIGEFKGVAPRLLPQFIHPDRLLDGTLTDAIMEMTQRVGKDAFLRQQNAIMGRADSRPHLSRIKVPTLVLCGRGDAMTPVERHVEIAEAIPKARLAIVEDSGHLTTMERPQAVTALLRDCMIYDR
ncbi:MAG: alpha/beta fold hydrolase [Alphaproteobacteria bacterium]